MPVVPLLSIKEKEARSTLVFYGFWLRIYRACADNFPLKDYYDSSLFLLTKLIFHTYCCDIQTIPNAHDILADVYLTSSGHKEYFDMSYGYSVRDLHDIKMNFWSINYGENLARIEKPKLDVPSLGWRASYASVLKILKKYTQSSFQLRHESRALGFWLWSVLSRSEFSSVTQAIDFLRSGQAFPDGMLNSLGFADSPLRTFSNLHSCTVESIKKGVVSSLR